MFIVSSDPTLFSFSVDYISRHFGLLMNIKHFI